MNTAFIPPFVFILAYLLGSLSSAIIVCKLYGLPDPRTEGSKNPGATNVLRLSNKKTAAMVLVGDLLKGLMAVLLGRLFGLSEYLLAWTAFAAVIGHIFPVFFHFKGGKGVATAFGGILALSWPIAIICLALWLLIAKISRYSSLAALTSTIAAPILSFFIIPSTSLPLFLIAILLFWTHRQNIQRLKNKTESKITF